MGGAVLTVACVAVGLAVLMRVWRMFRRAVMRHAPSEAALAYDAGYAAGLAVQSGGEVGPYGAGYAAGLVDGRAVDAAAGAS